ncbi:MAG: peptidoglycan DD-metalloendopeptidase family protein [Betaproteobacteria bacterium]|nr:peptidoglycan DD-metalloendopeptidase family protein [Betaproteobacteria bacterium]
MKVPIALLLLVLTSSTQAGFGGGGRGGGRIQSAPPPDSSQGAVRRGIQPSGLTPVFAGDAHCTKIASPYASPTRFDGSSRPLDRFAGLHGGIDLTLEQETPLLALAAGKVIALGVGGQAEGVYAWLQHAPADTGLPFWVYSKYQHLFALPKHALGDVLKVGEVVGLSGRTGTVGGHYGWAGYAHLHLTAVAAPGDEYQLEGTRVSAKGGRMMDPLAIYLRDLTSLDDLDRLDGAPREVRISHQTADGALRPAGSRIIWPVACQ